MKYSTNEKYNMKNAKWNMKVELHPESL